MEKISAVPVIMILIGHLVFSSISSRLKLHKWISNLGNCPQDEIQSTYQQSSLAADGGCFSGKSFRPEKQVSWVSGWTVGVLWKAFGVW